MCNRENSLEGETSTASLISCSKTAFKFSYLVVLLPAFSQYKFKITQNYDYNIQFKRGDQCYFLLMRFVKKMNYTQIRIVSQLKNNVCEQFTKLQKKLCFHVGKTKVVSSFKVKIA